MDLLEIKHTNAVIDALNRIEYEHIYVQFGQWVLRVRSMPITVISSIFGKRGEIRAQ